MASAENGPGVHGVQVADGVQGGDPAEQVRIIDERLEVIDRLHLDQPVRLVAEQFRPQPMDGRVLAGPAAQQDARIVGQVDPLQHGGQHVAGDLRAAAAAAHLRSVSGCDPRQARPSGAKRVNFIDPGAVDAVLEPPRPAALPGERPVAQDRLAVGRVQQAQEQRCGRNGRSGSSRRNAATLSKRTAPSRTA